MSPSNDFMLKFRDANRAVGLFIIFAPLLIQVQFCKMCFAVHSFALPSFLCTQNFFVVLNLRGQMKNMDKEISFKNLSPRQMNIRKYCAKTKFKGKNEI